MVTELVQEDACSGGDKAKMCGAESASLFEEELGKIKIVWKVNKLTGIVQKVFGGTQLTES